MSMDVEMAPLPLPSTAGGGRPRPFSPTAAAFTPKVFGAKKEVLHSSFITQTIPDVHRYAGVVCVCTVPEDKADMNEWGWYIADFLAFRALLCGNNHPKAQTWLTLCDIPALVEANPERYIHGKDRRLVGCAAKSKNDQKRGEPCEREDDVRVDTSPASLKDEFILAIREKLVVTVKGDYPLLLIICGFTSLEQDIYFGTIDSDNRYTLSDLRFELGDDINHIEATVVTPSLFSAGWQVNTSFGRHTSTGVRGNRNEFLARQFGGLFAHNLTKTFVGWNCPALDEAKVDPLVKAERFPGPVCPSDKTRASISQLQIKIHSCLVGGLSASHGDHSFAFDKENDDWEKLIRDRQGPPEYLPLQGYKQEWAKLPTAQNFESTDNGYKFLGNAFGGNKASQLNHIKCLIRESYLAWRDHWATNFGEETKKDFERFVNEERPDDLDCHEMFNILEHRARISSLGDAIIQYFDLPTPHNQRCRDFDNIEWKQELSEADRSFLIKYFGSVCGNVPGPNLPPGINPNNMSKIQRRLENGANYVRAALGVRSQMLRDSGRAAVHHIDSFIHEVEIKQAELLATSPEVHLLCSKWLSTIDMPVRGLRNIVGAMKIPQRVVAPDDAICPLDSDDEYEVYQDDNAQLNSAANSTEAENTGDNFILGQQFSPGPFGLSTPIKQATVAADHPEGTYVQQKPLVGHPKLTPEIKKESPIEQTDAQEREGSVRPRVEVDSIAEAIQLLTELRTSVDRERLTTELLKFLQDNKNLNHTEAKRSDDAVQSNGSKKTDKEGNAATSFTKANNARQSGGEPQRETSEGRTPITMPQASILQPQSPDATLPPHKRAQRPERAVHRDIPQSPVKLGPVTERKTPPHLRGLGGRHR